MPAEPPPITKTLWLRAAVVAGDAEAVANCRIVVGTAWAAAYPARLENILTSEADKGKKKGRKKQIN